MDALEAVVRLLLGFLLAMSIGLERQLHRKPVGFGTFAFVAVGACALAIVAVDLAPLGTPSTLLSGIITGIGFLGAGALIRTPDRVVGFTTAALVWAVAALGMTMGVGEYVLGFALYATMWAVILADRILEARGVGSHARMVRLTVSETVDLKALESLLSSERAQFERLEWERDAHEIRVTALVRAGSVRLTQLMEVLRQDEHVKSFEIE